MTHPAVDPIDLLLGATFGPTIAAEVAKEDKEAATGGDEHPSTPSEADGTKAPEGAATPPAVAGDGSADLPSGSPPIGVDGAVGPSDLPPHSPAGAAESEVAALPRWWKYNLDGTPRKRVQAPKVYGDGSGSGEAKRLETDRAVLAALHSGAETLAQLVATTGFVKVTVVRSVERLEQSGRVLKDKAPPTGKRGRRAFVFRPTTEPVVESEVGA